MSSNIMLTKNPIRKVQKKLRHCRQQHNKYHSINPELAREYFNKMGKLEEKIRLLNNPPPIVAYKKNKRKGVQPTKKSKFKKVRIDKATEFQNRKRKREIPSIMRNRFHKIIKKCYEEKKEEDIEKYIDRKYDVLMNLARAI